jgi:hypothetical protein
MDCHGFEAWLDGGRSANAAADAHAAKCPACAERLRMTREVEGALAQRFAVAPAGFADRVMAALPARAGDAPVRVPEDRESPWPWWIEIALEPQTAAALALAALYVAAAPALIGVGLGAGRSLLVGLGAAADLLPPAASAPGPLWAVGAAAALAAGSIALFRGSTRLFARAARLRAR